MPVFTCTPLPMYTRAHPQLVPKVSAVALSHTPQTLCWGLIEVWCCGCLVTLLPLGLAKTEGVGRRTVQQFAKDGRTHHQWKTAACTRGEGKHQNALAGPRNCMADGATQKKMPSARTVRAYGYAHTCSRRFAFLSDRSLREREKRAIKLGMGNSVLLSERE